MARRERLAEGNLAGGVDACLIAPLLLVLDETFERRLLLAAIDDPSAPLRKKHANLIGER